MQNIITERQSISFDQFKTTYEEEIRRSAEAELQSAQERTGQFDHLPATAEELLRSSLDLDLIAIRAKYILFDKTTGEPFISEEKFNQTMEKFFIVFKNPFVFPFTVSSLENKRILTEASLAFLTHFESHPPKLALHTSNGIEIGQYITIYTPVGEAIEININSPVYNWFRRVLPYDLSYTRHLHLVTYPLDYHFVTIDLKQLAAYGQLE